MGAESFFGDGVDSRPYISEYTHMLILLNQFSSILLWWLLLSATPPVALFFSSLAVGAYGSARPSPRETQGLAQVFVTG
jgi:membrane protein required for beta-lactamase induction